MGLILHKGSSIHLGHCISVVKLVVCCINVMMVKSLELCLTISLTLILLIFLFYKRNTWWKHLRGIGLVPSDAACCVSWGEGINTPYSAGSPWRPLSITYFDSLLLLFRFIGLCLLVSPDVNSLLFVLDLHMKYTVDVVSLSTHIVWFVTMW